VLNDVFVSRLPGLGSVHAQRSCSLQYACATVCWSCAFGHCCLLPESPSVKCSLLVIRLFQFFFENSFSILCQPYSLNCCKFLFNALSSVLNSTFLYRYFVTISKIVIYNNIVCFCLQTLEVYLKRNII